jgi:acylaminoacyl-peptidase
LDAATQTLALGMADVVTPSDIYVQMAPRDGEPAYFMGARRLTALNERLLAEVELAVPEELAFQGAEGWGLQGWVMRPPHARPGENVPAVLEIHGGPAAMYGYSFFFEFQLLAARGYAVIYSNPRGSTGYGRQFSGAVVRDWGGKDYEDVMAGLDAALARGGIDATRLGVAGGSYGGFMTAWVVSHTDRFKAAVTMRLLASWASFFGTSDIGPSFTLDHIGAAPWEHLDLLLEHSPYTYVANIQTPLLILHSDSDFRCPLSEAEQLFTALKWLGRETELVIFEGQSHDLSRNGHPRSRVIRLNEIAGWFENYIPVG